MNIRYIPLINHLTHPNLNLILIFIVKLETKIIYILKEKIILFIKLGLSYYLSFLFSIANY